MFALAGPNNQFGVFDVTENNIEGKSNVDATMRSCSCIWNLIISDSVRAICV